MTVRSASAASASRRSLSSPRVRASRRGESAERAEFARGDQRAQNFSSWPQNSSAAVRSPWRIDGNCSVAPPPRRGRGPRLPPRPGEEEGSPGFGVGEASESSRRALASESVRGAVRQPEEKYELSDEAVRCRSSSSPRARTARGSRRQRDEPRRALRLGADRVAVLVTRDDTPAERVRADALASLCRELGECVRASRPKPPPGVPLAALEYAVEPVNSFLEHVHDAVLGAQDGEKGGDIARRAALRTLGVSDADAGADPRACGARTARSRAPPPGRAARRRHGAGARPRGRVRARVRRVPGARRRRGGRGASAERGRSWYGRSAAAARRRVLGRRSAGAWPSSAAACRAAASGGWRAAVSRLDSDVIHAVASRNSMRAALAIDRGVRSRAARAHQRA